MRPAYCGALAMVVLGWTLGVGPTWAQDAPAPKLVAESEARTPVEERSGFHLPEGFVIELVASEPEINKPMNIAFDARGRLWVTSTVEYPYPVTVGKPARDRVVVLSDFADDGKARKVVTFAEGLNIPIGLLPIGSGSSALVHDIPNIRRFVDTDGDGKADRSEVVYEKYGFRDTHGMTNSFSWGFDGWIYACHGFSNDSKVEGSDKKPIVMQSGNVYRMKPDGSRVEYHSHGQVNPFGLAFDPSGNLYSCDCHSRPLYQLLRGAYYPSFGKPDDGLGFGPDMITHDHGSTGIGGITVYAADHFPTPYQNTTFIGNVVTSRINHDRLTWTGSTPKAVAQPDFLVSDDPWFRPVDIELGPDGALYVADFYNRIIGHYEVPLNHPGRDRERGRIWRIVYKGKDGQGKPPRPPRLDESTASLAELVDDLGHANLAVRTLATNLLVDRGAEACGPVLAKVVTDATSWQKVHGLWVLSRLRTLPNSAIEMATRDADEVVRIHAMRILADRPTLASGLVMVGLKDPSASVRRASAEALGRHPSSENIAPILDLLRSIDPADTHLKHVARMALRDQFDSSKAWESVNQLTGPDADAVADAALGVPSSDSAGFLVQHLVRLAEVSKTLTRLDRVVRFAHQIARYGDAEGQTFLLGLGQSHSEKMAILKAVQQGVQERGGSLGPEARTLASNLARSLLSSGSAAEVSSGIDLAGTMKLEGTSPILASVVNSRTSSTAQRNSAMTALVAVDPAASIVTMGRVLRDAAELVEVREQAANVLNGTGRPEARALLVEALSTAPARLQSTIATALAQTKPGAEALLVAIASGKASARPLQERGVSVRLEASGIPDVKARLETLLKELPPADRRVLELIEKRRGTFLATTNPNLSRGASVFEKNCASCHMLQGKGARVGPQLDGLGLRGLDRVLEDTLDPNRNVDQAFRVTTLGLNDGRVVSGLLLRQDGEVLVLADAQGQEVRVPVSAVEDRKLSQLSPMPANLVEQMDEVAFSDLIAYLLSQKPQ